MSKLPAHPWLWRAAPVTARGPEATALRRMGIRGVVLEAALIAALYLLYRFGRGLSAERISDAVSNANWVYRAQEWLGLPDETTIQTWVLTSPELIGMANRYYVLVHFPVTLAFLAWGYFRRPVSEYRWARALLFTFTAMALVLQVVVPLAPPRMFPRLGFVDTMATIGPSAYEGGLAGLANQYAAMPSVHVGWALVVAVVVVRTARGVIRWLAAGHAGVTTLVVVVTANHWWVDALVAAILLGIALLLHPRSRSPQQRRWNRRPRVGDGVQRHTTVAAAHSGMDRAVSG